MKKTFLKTAMVLAIALFAISCSKEGATGATGANGTSGIDGNANVLGSLPFSTASTNWASSSGGAIWTANVGATAITQSIVDRGIVSVFRKYTSNGAAEWSPLPDTNININISFDYGVGYIKLFTQSTNAVAITNPGVLTFRYVIISPANRMANPNTNWQDYNQVKKALFLKD